MRAREWECRASRVARLSRLRAQRDTERPRRVPVARRSRTSSANRVPTAAATRMET